MADVSSTAGGTSQVSPTVELGDSGLKRWGGAVDEEFVRDLKGSRATKVFQEMSLNDATVGAELFAVKNLCRRATVRIEAGSSAPEDQAAAVFVDECRQDMSHTWDDTLNDILTMLEQGWCYLEMVWKIRGGDVADPTRRSRYNDGKFGWRKLAFRSQDSLHDWKFDASGGVQAMVQRHPTTGQLIEIPIDKSLLFRPSSTKNNPQGQSVLRTAYRPWYFKRQLEVFRAIGFERNVAGMPVFYIPAEYLADGATADQQAVANAFKEAGTNLRRDEQMCLVLPQAYDASGNALFKFEFAAPPGTGVADITEAIRQHTQEMAQTILADLILIGHEQAGSYALLTEKVSLFAAALDGWLRAIADVLNRFAVPALLRLNGMRVKNPPRFVFGPVERVHLKDMAEFITALAGAGAIMFPDEPLEAYLRSAGQLPALETVSLSKGMPLSARVAGALAKIEGGLCA